jgi:hypothetical protein
VGGIGVFWDKNYIKNMGFEFGMCQDGVSEMLTLKGGGMKN